MRMQGGFIAALEVIVQGPYAVVGLRHATVYVVKDARMEVSPSVQVVKHSSFVLVFDVTDVAADIHFGKVNPKRLLPSES